MEQRKSNLELLRIISIILIIIFHCAFKSRFDYEMTSQGNYLLVKTFWMFGELGVNLFVLISGYFMVDGHFKGKKVIRLLLEVQFYFWITFFIGYKVGICELSSWKDIFVSFFPVIFNKYWFITAYIIIYILSPYINLLICAMDKKVYRRLLCTGLILYCVIPTFFGVFSNTTEGLLYYNRMIWLIIMYLIGAYIKKCVGWDRKICRQAGIASVCSFVFLVCSILIVTKHCKFFEALGITESAYFWPPNTIPMVILSVGIFILFLHVKISYNIFINTIASTTLGIYLLHDGVLASWLWNTVFRCAEYQSSPFLIFYILRAGVVIFAAGVAIDLIRQILEKYTLLKILNIKH